MRSLLTKESRLQSQQAQFDSLINSGYIREDYKGMKFFTRNDGKYFTLKVFRDAASHLLEYVNYRTAERMAEVIQNYKNNYDSRQQYKAECKANPKKSTAANCAAAIREELKNNFPGIKFYVTCENYSMGNSVSIDWTDGPTVKEVEQFTSKYQYGHFNGMEDIYENSNSRDDIPQAKYVKEHRNKSPEISALLPQLETMMHPEDRNDRYNGAENMLYRIFQKQSFPAGAKITGIEKSGVTCGSYEDFFIITFEAPEQARAAAQPNFTPVEVEPGIVQIIDYSPKAIAVIGDTKPIKDKLKALGGSFNFRLTCGAGWIFPKTKLTQLQTALTA